MTGVSTRSWSFEAVVMPSDVMSVSGSKIPSSVGSALRNLAYLQDQSILFGDGISFDGSGAVVGPKKVVVQVQSRSTRVLSGSADMWLVTDRQL